MKNLFRLLFFAFIVCCLFACKKDKVDKPTTVSDALVGKWHQISKRQTIYLNGKPMVLYNPNEHYAETGYVQYFNDGTATYNENGTVQRNFKLAVKNGLLSTLNNNGTPSDADSKITVTATTLNLHQDISGNDNEPETIDLDFVRVN